MAAGWLLIALFAGAALPIQAGVNAELANWIGGPVRASAVSFAVGTVALTALALVLIKAWPVPHRLGHAPWWVWVGGILGAVYVGSAVAAAPRLGAVALVAAVVAGQSICSVILDRLGAVGFERHPITAGRIAGLVLLVSGVALVRVF